MIYAEKSPDFLNICGNLRASTAVVFLYSFVEAAANSYNIEPTIRDAMGDMPPVLTVWRGASDANLGAPWQFIWLDPWTPFRGIRVARVLGGFSRLPILLHPF